MASIREVQAVKPICGVTFGSEPTLEDILKSLSGVFGKVDLRSDVFDFYHTDYYAAEMGTDLRKVFFSFQGVMYPGRLSEIKNKTNDLEGHWMKNGKRFVNLDPGYMTLAKVVMASVKDFAHRVFIGDGIYADIQLQFRDNAFQIQPWTFPDYQSETALVFFISVRDKLQEEVKAHG